MHLFCKKYKRYIVVLLLCCFLVNTYYTVTVKADAAAAVLTIIGAGSLEASLPIVAAVGAVLLASMGIDMVVSDLASDKGLTKQQYMQGLITDFLSSTGNSLDMLVAGASLTKDGYIVLGASAARTWSDFVAFLQRESIISSIKGVSNGYSIDNLSLAAVSSDTFFEVQRDRNNRYFKIGGFAGNSPIYAFAYLDYNHYEIVVLSATDFTFSLFTAPTEFSVRTNGYGVLFGADDCCVSYGNLSYNQVAVLGIPIVDSLPFPVGTDIDFGNIKGVGLSADMDQVNAIIEGITDIPAEGGVVVNPALPY